jgi:hypothetical protein
LDIVDLSRVEKIIKNRKKVPSDIVDNLQIWVEQVEKFGIYEVQKVQRWKDHGISGLRKGQRAIRLSFLWRAIYRINKNGTINMVLVEEITPHDYR